MLAPSAMLGRWVEFQTMDPQGLTNYEDNECRKAINSMNQQLLPVVLVKYQFWLGKNKSSFATQPSQGSQGSGVPFIECLA
jgi:hypothetical protein